jgi:hypothetical protein
MEVNNQLQVSFSLSRKEVSVPNGWQADWGTDLMSEAAGDEGRVNCNIRQTDTWNS